jgi:hypothetical protein
VDLPTLLTKAYNLKSTYVQKNQQKLAIPWNISAESMSWVMYSSKKHCFTPFFASEQAKA